MSRVAHYHTMLQAEHLFQGVWVWENMVRISEGQIPQRLPYGFEEIDSACQRKGTLCLGQRFPKCGGAPQGWHRDTEKGSGAEKKSNENPKQPTTGRVSMAVHSSL